MKFNAPSFQGFNVNPTNPYQKIKNYKNKDNNIDGSLRT